MSELVESWADEMDTEDRTSYECERFIVNEIEEYLVSPVYNQFQGTIAVEKIQNFLKNSYKDKYERVVDDKKFIEFLKLQPVFILKMMADPGQTEKSWRIASKKINWRRGDRNRQTFKVNFDNSIVRTCMAYINEQPYYSTDINNLVDLVRETEMRRGDLLRLLGRYTNYFTIASYGDSKIVALNFLHNQTYSRPTRSFGRFAQ